MRKLKIVILLLIMIAGAILLTGCGNYDHFDTNYTYTKAITYLGNEKIEIDITFKNNAKKHLVGISPVDTTQIQEWLKKDNLYEKAKMYRF